MMGEESLRVYLERNFSLIENNTLRLTEIEDMIPWMREVYINMFIVRIRERYSK
jgi:hypothetical protein